jgi:H+/Cl- antiporter ClcA
MHQIGKYLIIIGIIAVLAGLILYFFGNRLSWLGHLPGDIRVEKEHFRFYFPITTMILLSLLLSLILWIIRKLF